MERVMKSVLKMDLVYAAALTGAACLGSMVAFAAPAAAQTAESSRVVLSSIAMIERVVVGADGKEVATLKKPNEVAITPGDRVVFTLRYQNKGALPATGFRATNPMPGPVQFVAATEDWAEVSVDGGTTWGKLSDLLVTIKAADGVTQTMRAATVEDVTHVRWVFSDAIAPGAEGQLSYRGVVK
jgi:uncharacterized repeat protein (TIGR01451 family)